MKQQQFETQHAALWQAMTEIVARKERAPELPQLYRRLCLSLALAEQRGYSPALCDYLRNLVSAGHQRLYGAAAERPRTLLRWLAHDFPRQVRAEWRWLLLAALALWGVALAVGLLVWYRPYWAYSIAAPQQLDNYRRMYQPGQLRIGRGSEGDIQMFGYYIWNNVSINFRTFAGGVAGGVPALLSLAFNGLHTGLVASWLSRDPDTRNTFWSFVVTHASFEVTGLMLSGQAGMRLGWALIHPGRLSRQHALQQTATAMFPVLVGAALLTVLAAFFEAFWSANPDLPDAVKYAVGGACWLLVIAFFTFAGRGRR